MYLVFHGNVRLAVPVMKADLWRYLILLERGGIFADLDVLPSTTNNTIKRIPPDADAAFFLVHTAGQNLLSQWFLATSPRHPLMYDAIQIATTRVLKAKRAIPIQHTGPRALYDATSLFLQSPSRDLKAGQTYYHSSK
jgi:alpha 1,6-mannosyltransferase